MCKSLISAGALFLAALFGALPPRADSVTFHLEWRRDPGRGVSTEPPFNQAA
jgi:hypothetical protein